MQTVYTAVLLSIIYIATSYDFIKRKEKNAIMH